MKLIRTLICGLAVGLAGCGQTPVETPPETNQSFAFEQGRFHTLLNRARAENGLRPLQVSAKLTAAAQGHANDMSRGSFFSHDGSDGRSVGRRVAATGYGHCWVSENISWNRTSEAEAFARWMASPGHRQNMLAAEPSQYGLAVAPGNYRVMVLGRPGC